MVDAISSFSTVGIMGPYFRHEAAYGCGVRGRRLHPEAFVRHPSQRRPFTEERTL
jgi:hypothetical protein